MDTNKPDPSTDGRKAGLGAECPPSDVSSVRRKLVKGGVLVPPVMLTLRSGAAAAQASAATCLAANQSAAQDAPGLAAERDEWMRSHIILKEARRVRKVKRNGMKMWIFKGNKVSRLYTHTNGNRGTWISLRPGLSGRRWRLVDTGRVIEVYDPITGSVMLTGNLMHRRGNPLRKFVAIAEAEALGLLQFDQNGDLVVDEDGDPIVVEASDPTQQATAVTTSCWASLHPTAQI